MDRERQVMQRLKLDIAELKGPPNVEQVIKKQKESADNLLLVINSGRYKGKRLDYLKEMHSKMLDRRDPTQDEINTKHSTMIDQQKNGLFIRNNNMRKKQIQPNRHRQKMRQKKDSK
jgi:hypothetical protein